MLATLDANESVGSKSLSGAVGGGGSRERGSPGGGSRAGPGAEAAGSVGAGAAGVGPVMHGMDMDVVIEPAGNFTACRAAVGTLLGIGGDCPHQRCGVAGSYLPQLRGTFLATENFFYTAQVPLRPPSPRRDQTYPVTHETQSLSTWTLHQNPSLRP